MANHWLRGLQVFSGATGGDVSGQVLRLIYEFWGYCVNGTTALTTPGGMPTTPTNGPANGFEGTTVLATGSDGATTDNSETFTSAGASFNSSMVGSYLVVWSPGSGSSEDSIYRILNVPTSTTLQLDVTSGGSPHPTTLNVRLTTRSNLRYRIVDLSTVGTQNWVIGHHVVIQFNGPAINTGQANSQVRFAIENTQTEIVMYLSPGGTWTGAAFTDSSAQIEATVNTSGWFNSMGASENNWFTMIADEGSLIILVSGGALSSGSSGLHVEIPERIYDQADDPNPIAGMMWGVDDLRMNSSTLYYGKGFRMRSQDTSTYAYDCLTRASRGNGFSAGGADGQAPIGQLLTDSKVALNTFTGNVLSSPVLLSLGGVSGQFQFARARLRRVLFYSHVLGNDADRRLGLNGEWITIRNGIAWPWDNVRMGRKLNPGGT